jgi:hypothetical protein
MFENAVALEIGADLWRMLPLASAAKEKRNCITSTIEGAST